MNGRFQMQGGKNWILPKEMNANRFFWDFHWLEILSNHFCPSMGPNGGSVAMDSGRVAGLARYKVLASASDDRRLNSTNSVARVCFLSKPQRTVRKMCCPRMRLFYGRPVLPLYVDCTENSKQIFPEMKLRCLSFPISAFMCL